MSTDYIYTETSHLDHRSIFYNIQLPNDKDLLEAIKIWELAADAKYIDILGYGQYMLYKSVDPQDCAKKEVDKIYSLLNTGSCELCTGYNDFELEQIPLAYKAMLTGRWNDFISLDATRAYLDSGQDDTMIDYYFSRKWVVATQVQALIWYKEFMHDVEKNGITFREDENTTNQDKTSFETSSSGKIKKECNLVRPLNELQKQDNGYDEFIAFTKKVLKKHPDATTADLRRNCFEDMNELNSRDGKIINDLLIKAGAKKSNQGEHANKIEWGSKYSKAQWVRVFNKKKQQSNQ